MRCGSREISEFRSRSCAALLALLVVSVLIVAHHRSVQAEQQRSAEFAAAARQGVVTLMSLNFNRAQDDVKRIIDGGETNYISATLNIYLDLYNVFQTLLSLLGIFGGDRR